MTEGFEVVFSSSSDNSEYKDVDNSQQNVDGNKSETVQSFLEWERDKYVFLGQDKEGSKYFLCLNVVNSKYTVLVRIRLSKKAKDGQWETLTKFYVDCFEFAKVVRELERVSRKALELQLGL